LRPPLRLERAPLAGGLALAAGLLVFACHGPENTLEGSLSDEASLAFDRVEIQRAPAQVRVRYLRDLDGGGGGDLVLSVSANTQGLDLTQAASIDLVESASGTQRGGVARAVSGDARRQFPPLQRGRLSFESAVASGATVGGSFSLLFGFGSGQLGEGRTAFGTFRAPVVQVGP
jgi:hypothetical protein